MTKEWVSLNQAIGYGQVMSTPWSPQQRIDATKALRNVSVEGVVVSAPALRAAFYALEALGMSDRETVHLDEIRSALDSHEGRDTTSHEAPHTYRDAAS
jgi:hypothetical protein